MFESSEPLMKSVGSGDTSGLRNDSGSAWSFNTWHTCGNGKFVISPSRLPASSRVIRVIRSADVPDAQSMAVPIIPMPPLNSPNRRAANAASIA